MGRLLSQRLALLHFAEAVTALLLPFALVSAGINQVSYDTSAVFDHSSRCQQ